MVSITRAEFLLDMVAVLVVRRPRRETYDSGFYDLGWYG